MIRLDKGVNHDLFCRNLQPLSCFLQPRTNGNIRSRFLWRDLCSEASDRGYACFLLSFHVRAKTLHSEEMVPCSGWDRNIHVDIAVSERVSLVGVHDNLRSFIHVFGNMTKANQREKDVDTPETADIKEGGCFLIFLSAFCSLS
ncbi:hypothetical protein PoB_001452100 [Plakobranchus ocellatus]|uniref:Uncharacterized protein n=1 Tax=Plakobranchus ocellatus TaxID=259542 RepID=A0AAV3Z0B1_9GAST|nr:hypothetical protein PoB_001452100 [Plakobranchus ocellatus]